MPAVAVNFACFRSAPRPGKVDADIGIIYGAKILEADRAANDLWTDKKLVGDMLGLISGAGGMLDCFWTHDWTDADTDPLHEYVGVWKEFRIDSDGDLIADLHLLPDTDYRQRILWLAQNHPLGAMVSANFTFTPREQDGKTYPDPVEIQSADIVKKGAATSAMFRSKTNPRKPMTDEDTTALLSSDGFKTALADAVKTAFAEIKPEPKPQAQFSEAAMQKALADHAVAMEAKFTSLIGAKTAPTASDDGSAAKDNKYAFLARLTKHYEAEPNIGKAILRAAAQAPKEYGEWHQAGRPGINTITTPQN